MTARTIVIIGGGICGTLAAVLLARDGHQVTVIERDDVEPPEGEGNALAEWDRTGIRQFQMGHFFLARFRQELQAEIPEVLDELDAAGAYRVNFLAGMPETMSGGMRDGDDRYEVVTARRPVAESAVQRVAAREPGLAIRRGTAVSGLVVDHEHGVADVSGVTLDDGSTLPADLVVDCAGRQSPVPRLLAAHDAAPQVEVDDSGFVYYGATLQSDDGSMPPMLGGALQHHDSISMLTLPADNGSWFASFVAMGSDATMRKVRDREVFERTWRAYPLTAHWLDGRWLHDEIKVMGKIEDQVRTYVVDDTPVVTGLVPLADAWACTNPSVGRGASMGLIHAVALRDLLRDAPPDPVGFARAWHEATEETVAPYFRETLDGDGHRLGQIRASIEGSGPYQTDDPWYPVMDAFPRAAVRDPEIVRPYFAYVQLLETAEEIFAADASLADRVLEVGGEPDPPLGPLRSELVGLLTASG